MRKPPVKEEGGVKKKKVFIQDLHKEKREEKEKEKTFHKKAVGKNALWNWGNLRR